MENRLNKVINDLYKMKNDEIKQYNINIKESINALFSSKLHKEISYTKFESSKIELFIIRDILEDYLFKGISLEDLRIKYINMDCEIITLDDLQALSNKDLELYKHKLQDRLYKVNKMLEEGSNEKLEARKMNIEDKINSIEVTINFNEEAELELYIDAIKDIEELEILEEEKNIDAIVDTIVEEAYKILVNKEEEAEFNKLEEDYNNSSFKTIVDRYIENKIDFSESEDIVIENINNLEYILDMKINSLEAENKRLKKESDKLKKEVESFNKLIKDEIDKNKDTTKKRS